MNVTQQLSPRFETRLAGSDAEEERRVSFSSFEGVSAGLKGCIWHSRFSRKRILTNNRPMLSSNHSTRCCNPAIVASASLLVPIPAQISVSPPPMVLGATPQSSAYEGFEWLEIACVRLERVEGVGRGVDGEEWVWKLGGGEEGIEDACWEEATELGIAELKFWFEDRISRGFEAIWRMVIVMVSIAREQDNAYARWH